MEYKRLFDGQKVDLVDYVKDYMSTKENIETGSWYGGRNGI